MSFGYARHCTLYVGYTEATTSGTIAQLLQKHVNSLLLDQPLSSGFIDLDRYMVHVY